MPSAVSAACRPRVVDVVSLVGLGMSVVTAFFWGLLLFGVFAMLTTCCTLDDALFVVAASVTLMLVTVFVALMVMSSVVREFWTRLNS